MILSPFVFSSFPSFPSFLVYLIIGSRRQLCLSSQGSTSEQIYPPSVFSDLFFVGKSAYPQADYASAADWFHRALRVATATEEEEARALAFLSSRFIFLSEVGP